jgi:arginine decarboxylase
LKALTKKLGNEFLTGDLSLSEKALAERLINYAYREILNSKYELEKQDRAFLQDKFVAKYFCNFSLFQSAPDIWGLKQIFPIMPLHRNNEFPAIKSRIYDLTCDSDGRIDKYVEADTVQAHLSLHVLKQQQDYIIGIFLVGAYQEILGDMHNLFGDTHAVNIVINADGSYQKCDEQPSDTIAEILSYLHIDTDRMRQVWDEKLDSNNVSGHKKEHIMKELAASLHVNSYLS